VVKGAEGHREKLAQDPPKLQPLPPPQTCNSSGYRAGKKGVRIPYSSTYPCPDNGVARGIENANRDAQQHHDNDLAKAEEEVGKARNDLRAAEAIPAPDTNQLASKLQDAQSDLELAKADSVMHRAAAAWFGIDVGELSTAQFEVFKKWAMFGLAAATATVTMITAFVANMPRRDGKSGKVGMAWRAYLARRRKKLVRVVEKVIRNRPPLKVLEIKYLPFDPASGRVINSDGSKGEFANKGSAI
jgi:hypothetical protein